MAVCQSCSGLRCGGFYTNVFEDRDHPVILATVTPSGHGSVTHSPRWARNANPFVFYAKYSFNSQHFAGFPVLPFQPCGTRKVGSSVTNMES